MFSATIGVPTKRRWRLRRQTLARCSATLATCANAATPRRQSPRMTKQMQPTIFSQFTGFVPQDRRTKLESAMHAAGECAVPYRMARSSWNSCAEGIGQERTPNRNSARAGKREKKRAISTFESFAIYV